MGVAGRVRDYFRRAAIRTKRLNFFDNMVMAVGERDRLFEPPPGQTQVLAPGGVAGFNAADPGRRLSRERLQTIKTARSN